MKLTVAVLKLAAPTGSGWGKEGRREGAVQGRERESMGRGREM